MAVVVAVFLETEECEDLPEATEGEGDAERGVEASEVPVLYVREAVAAEAICDEPAKRCDAEATRDSDEGRDATGEE